MAYFPHDYQYGYYNNQRYHSGNNYRYDINYNNNGGRQLFKQREASLSSKKQQTAFCRSFLDQTEAVFKHLGNILKMLSKPDRFDEDFVNLTTDLLIDSLNAFAANCYDLQKEGNRDALDLAKKRVLDERESVPSDIASQTAIYYDFLMDALNSKKLLKFKKQRVLSKRERAEEQRACSNPKNINAAYANFIHAKVKYEKKSESYLKDNVNKILQTEQEKQLKEFRKNKKYQQNDKKTAKNISYKTADLYFTQSGKTSKFSKSGKDDHKDDLDDILMGGTEHSDHSSDIGYSDTDSDGDKDVVPERYALKNAVVMLSNKKPLNGICEPVPCLILSTPNERQHKFNIKLAEPYNSKHWIDPDEFTIVHLLNAADPKYHKMKAYIQNIETKWCSDCYVSHLGYATVNERDNPSDLNAAIMGGHEDNEKNEGNKHKIWNKCKSYFKSNE